MSALSFADDLSNSYTPPRTRLPGLVGKTHQCGTESLEIAHRHSKILPFLAYIHHKAKLFCLRCLKSLKSY